MGIYDRVIGWMFNKETGKWKQPAADEAVYTDAGGNKRAASMERHVGVGRDGKGYEYYAMCGLPDPDVHYPKPRRDIFDEMAEDGPNSAAWYRGLYSKAFWEE